MPRPLPRLLVPLPLLLFAAGVEGCGHTEAGSFTPVVQDSAFQAGEPLRLTISDGRDRTPSWSTDAGRIAYAF
ncbi:MAG TPA: hypothetical protein VG940_11680, partial [Gemmatimonadales bacterium]|nr:hypothetical protein [Gemmatimonadales bacterium]